MAKNSIITKIDDALKKSADYNEIINRLYKLSKQKGYQKTLKQTLKSYHIMSLDDAFRLGLGEVRDMVLNDEQDLDYFAQVAVNNARMQKQIPKNSLDGEGAYTVLGDPTSISSATHDAVKTLKSRLACKSA